MSREDGFASSQSRHVEGNVLESELERGGRADRRDKRTGEPLDSVQSAKKLDVGGGWCRR